MQGLRRAGRIWLDVTRLIGRVGRGALTGIDRVELAYLTECLAADGRFLARTTRGYLAWDARGGALLRQMALDEVAPGRADRLSRAMGKAQRMRHRVEATLRPLALDRCLPHRLPRMMKRLGGHGTYLNVGHANLSQRTLRSCAAIPDLRVAVLIHDLIPINHPGLCAPGMDTHFAARLERVRTSADLVICNSYATAADLGAYWRDATGTPQRIVAHLGVEPRPRSAPGPRDPMHFLMLGTVEARKGHGLILDVWERFAAAPPAMGMPHLHIVGTEGWQVADLLERLARHPLVGTSIHWHGPLPDADVDAQLAKATALLFPSQAEGYGYPPLEAALAGALPICSDLPVFRETLGDCAVYVPQFDAYSWQATIAQHIDRSLNQPDLSRLKVPDWATHFETVGQVLAQGRAEGP